MTQEAGVIVIGASVGGLAAAALVSRAGVPVTVLERAASVPEPCAPLFALDPALVARLALHRHGLAFARRDLPLAALDNDLLLIRDTQASARRIDAFSDHDAKTWPLWRRDLFARARMLRRWWWSARDSGTIQDTLWGHASFAAGVFAARQARADFEQLCVTGADAWLGAWFQSDILRRLLLQDATLGGFAPSEPGSALALVWRAAQEMAGLQMASAVAKPGTLVAALRRAGPNVRLRTGASVIRILARDAGVQGVVLADGTELRASVILSCLSRAATQALVDGMAPQRGLTQACVTFTVSSTTLLPPGRHMLAPESQADAFEAARAGLVPAILPLEAAQTAPDRLSVIVRPVPGAGLDKTLLAARVVKALSRRAPDLAGAIRAVAVDIAGPHARASLANLTAPSLARVRTPLQGLYLCGSDAEPLPCVSGRAGRFAALLALQSQTETPPRRV